MTDEERDQFIREIIEELDNKGYRDPLGRNVTVHLVVKYLGGDEGKRPYRGQRAGWDNVAPTIEDMADTGRLYI